MGFWWSRTYISLTLGRPLGNHYPKPRFLNEEESHILISVLIDDAIVKVQGLEIEEAVALGLTARLKNARFMRTRLERFEKVQELMAEMEGNENYEHVFPLLDAILNPPVKEVSDWMKKRYLLN